MNFNNLLQKNFLKFDDVKNLHFELTNIVYIAREKNESWYCFCDKTTCCCFKQKNVPFAYFVRKCLKEA